MITKEFMDLYKPTHTEPKIQRAEVVKRMLDEVFLQVRDLDPSKKEEEIWKEIFSSVDLIKPMFGVYRSREASGFGLFRITKSVLVSFIDFLGAKSIINNVAELKLFITNLKYEDIVNMEGLENSYFRDVESVIAYIDDVGKCLYYDSHKNDETLAPRYDESTMLLDEKVVAILLWNGIIPADMIKLNKYDIHKVDGQCFITFKRKQISITQAEYEIIKCYAKLEKRGRPPKFSPARRFKKTNKLIRGSSGTPTANGICALLKRFNSYIEEKTPYIKKLTVTGLTRSNFYSKVHEEAKTSKLSAYGIIKRMTGADNKVAHCQSKEYLVWKKIFYPEQ